MHAVVVECRMVPLRWVSLQRKACGGVVVVPLLVVVRCCAFVMCTSVCASRSLGVSLSAKGGRTRVVSLSPLPLTGHAKRAQPECHRNAYTGTLSADARLAAHPTRSLGVI